MRFALFGFIAILLSAQTFAAEAGQINNRTLNYFLNVTHLSLPCYLPIELKVAYNSYTNKDSQFGDRWTFNHNIGVKPTETGLSILEGDGFLNEYHAQKTVDLANAALAKKIQIARKKSDSKKGGLKSKNIYDEYYKKLLNDKHFRKTEMRSFIGTKLQAGPGKYYSFARGRTVLRHSFFKEFWKVASLTRRVYRSTRRCYNYNGC